MRALLLCLAAPAAALALIPTPLQAQIFSAHHGDSPRIRFGAPSPLPGGFCGGDGHHRSVRCGQVGVVMDWYGGEWALYNNRSWDPDSYNDWWHDRPDRAFPRWVQHNEDCTPDRMWWSGSGWH